MKRIEKIKILKAIVALLLFIGIPILLFYLGVVVPEYCACDETMYEGQKGIDIWGDMVYFAMLKVRILLRHFFSFLRW
ncbi:hypothetical protein [Epilithonimonas hungarica]|uniref:Uncharacterized protein n=1 Tax=Epilithonimonas hungarica TaxID=454006 RepID=A0A1G7UDR2_9FLAO|nr:hypothetical protein [Epilithonimonas hungarica]SDG45726.1 hypothetical protein SAMN05421825_3410 [Epilithonimonas hungarica]